jgi:predicted Zn finger-like uncharacterized protein
MITTTCANCHSSLEVPPHYLGREVKCPQCSNTFVASDDSAAIEVPQPLPVETIPEIIQKKEELAMPPQHASADSMPLSSSPQEETTVSGILGLFMLIIGLIIVVFYFFLFTTDVDGGEMRVNNLGKMNDRQCGIIFGGILSIVGAILGTGKAR